MKAQTITHLDKSNSEIFVSKGRPKHAIIRWEPRDYELSWGSQSFDGPHVVVIDPNGEYGVDLEVFFTTHKPLPDRHDYYVKRVSVRALQVTEDTCIVTEVKGQKEMDATVPAGAWIIQNPSGELYYNSNEEFEKRYRRQRPE